jgi:uncharacterized membrane protein YfcA
MLSSFILDSLDNSTSLDINYIFTELEWPPSALNIIGNIVIFVMSVMGTAGGIGGAGIAIPFMMIFFHIPIKECVPLANIFGLISGLVRFIYNYHTKHPNNP